jgi:hypothetical protein
LQVLQHNSCCGDVWRLQLVQLLLQDWLLLPHQAIQLLNVFDKYVLACCACTLGAS